VRGTPWHQPNAPDPAVTDTGDAGLEFFTHDAPGQRGVDFFDDVP